MKHHNGSSLAEILLSLLLSSILMTAMITLYFIAKRTYQHSIETLSQELELKLVTEFVRDSIRAAGFTPCLGLDHLIIKDRRVGHESVRAIQLKAQGMQLSRMSENYISVHSKINEEHISLSADKSIMVTDCFHAEIMQVAQLKNPLHFSYSKPFYIGEWIEEQFNIKKNSEGKFALFYGIKQREELSSEIIGMEISFQKPLLQIVLKLKAGKTILLQTRVRTP